MHRLQAGEVDSEAKQFGVQGEPFLLYSPQAAHACRAVSTLIGGRLPHLQAQRQGYSWSAVPSAADMSTSATGCSPSRLTAAA